MDARISFFGFQIVSGVSNKPFPTYFGAVTDAEHVFENVQKCFKIIIFKLENRISMINSRSVPKGNIFNGTVTLIYDGYKVS